MSKVCGNSFCPFRSELSQTSGGCLCAETCVQYTPPRTYLWGSNTGDVQYYTSTANTDFVTERSHFDTKGD